MDAVRDAGTKTKRSGAPNRSLCGIALVTLGGTVQLSVIALNVIYAIIGVVLMYLSYRVIDRLTPEVDFPAELQKGNIAVAIFMAAIFISIAMIIGKALG